MAMTDCTMLDGVMTVIISELGSLSYEERRRVIEALEALYPPRGAIVPVPYDKQTNGASTPEPLSPAEISAFLRTSGAGSR
jgi:hypothetical protein